MPSQLTTDLIEQGRALLVDVQSLKVALDRLVRQPGDCRFELGPQDLYFEERLDDIGKWFKQVEDTVPKHDRPRLQDLVGAIERLTYLQQPSNEVTLEPMRTDLNAVAHHLQTAINLVRHHWVRHVLSTRQTLTEIEAAEVLQVSDKTIRNYKRGGKLHKTNTGRITTASVQQRLKVPDD